MRSVPDVSSALWARTGDARFEALASQLAHASPEVLERFWERVRSEGTPLVAPHPETPGLRVVTFLWRSPAELDGVHLHANRITDKHLRPAGEMRPIPGTGIWGVTLELRATSRFSYGFTPRPRGAPEPVAPRGGRGITTLPDPTNRRPPLRLDGDHGLSVFSGDEAPRQAEWDPAPSEPEGGRVESGEVPLLSGSTRSVRLYTPPPSGAPAALLVLFDGEVWFDDLRVASAIERAHASGRIPSLAVVGIANHGRQDRLNSLSANPEFLREIARHVLPWAEYRFAESGVPLGPREHRVVCGQSLGGLSALYACLETPDSYGAAIAHSTSMWWRPGGTAAPASLGVGGEPDWITSQFADRPAADVRIRLDTGEREGPTVTHTRCLADVLRARGYEHELRTFDGGHDFACWRGALIDGLASVLEPRGPASPLPGLPTTVP